MTEKQSLGIQRFLNSLNGWQRIGVILSIGWVLLVCAEGLTATNPTLLEFLSALTIPIILLWVTPPALLFVYRWVVDGFKKGN